MFILSDSKGVNVPVFVLVSAGLQSPTAEHPAVSAQSGSEQMEGRVRRFQGLEQQLMTEQRRLHCLWLQSANQSRAPAVS